MKNVAIIGYGGQGAWHAKEILKSDVVSLCGVYDIKEARCAAAKNNGIRVYASVDELLNDSAVDIVVVATPNDVHEQLVIKSLCCGKNVICEKPAALSVESFDRMTLAAKQNGRKLTVHQNRRFDVDFLAVKGAVDSGELGELINLESRVHGSRGIPSDWRCLKEYGGGMILDWGVHLIDQALQIFKGETIETVYCEATAITGSEVDDGFHLSINFAGGKRAFIEVGTYNFLPLPRFYMQCKEGTLKIEDWRVPAEVAKLKAWCEKDVLPVQTAAGITKTMAPRDELTVNTYTLPRPTSDVHDFYRNFCLALDGKAEQLVKNDEVRTVLKVMKAAFLSAETKTVVEYK